MRHRKKGRKLGRSPSHRKALLRNLASSLLLTERDAEGEEGAPKVKGRIITTIQKAKEVRPLVEKCITIARRSLGAAEAAEQFATEAERGTQEWRDWRQSERWQEWNQAIAPTVTARRHTLKLLGSKQAVSILFAAVAPRFADRNGGYTRILRLATPRLGDGGTRAILEFVGEHDRVAPPSEKPAFSDEDLGEEETETTSEQAAADDMSGEQPTTEETDTEQATAVQADETTSEQAATEEDPDVSSAEEKS